MGVARHVAHHSGDLAGVGVVPQDRLPQRVLVAEELARQVLAQDHGVGFQQCRRRVAAHEREVEDLEDVRLRKGDALVELVSAAGKDRGEIPKARNGLDLGDLIGQLPGQRRPQPAEAAPAQVVNAVCVTVEGLEAQLVLDVEQDQQAARHPYSHAENVDQGVRLVPEEVAQGCSEVVPEHGRKNGVSGRTMASAWCRPLPREQLAPELRLPHRHRPHGSSAMRGVHADGRATRRLLSVTQSSSDGSG